MAITGCRDDDLVRLLNAEGYQPIIIPRTNVTPPEMYTYAQDRLIRRGPLADYLPSGATLPRLRKGSRGDIQHKESRRKNVGTAASFLEDALKCMGVTSAPKLDLSFAQGCALTFSFTGVTYEGVNPSDLDELLVKYNLQLGAIPAEYVADGRLHIAYEYAYASSLLMKSADNSKFRADLKGVKVEHFIDIGAEAKVAAESETTIRFSSKTGKPAAFAIKVGQLEQRGKAWAFYPEEQMGSGYVSTEVKQPYLLEPGAIVLVEDIET
jgi:hypothetical protein